MIIRTLTQMKHKRGAVIPFITELTSSCKTNMRELTDKELYQALSYTKTIDEETGRNLMAQFQLEHPALAEILFAVFPSIIARENESMSYLFMDLCFDVMCVFQTAFGSLPSRNEMDGDWLKKQAMLLDVELQALMKDRVMDDRIRSKLHERLLQRRLDEVVQNGLINFMNAAIDDYSSENTSRVAAIETTQTLIFIVIRLLSNLYDQAEKIAGNRRTEAF